MIHRNASGIGIGTLVVVIGFGGDPSNTDAGSGKASLLGWVRFAPRNRSQRDRQGVVATFGGL
jgi:hypothetical protein